MHEASGRVTGLALLLPLIGLLLAGAWSWSDVATQLEAALRRDMVLLRAQTLQALDTDESVLVAVDIAIANLTWPQIRASEPVHRLLVQLAETAGAVDTLGLVDPDGRIAAASDMALPAIPIDVSDRDYDAVFPPGAHAAVGFIGAAVLSRVDGQPQVHMVRPRVPAPGAPEGPGDGGLIVAGFRPAMFESLFAQIERGQPGSVLLLRQDGGLLARFPDPLTPGHLRALPAGDPILLAAAALPPGEAVRVEAGRMAAIQRIGRYGLLLAISFDPGVAGRAWLREMVFPTVGALTTALLLLLLNRRAQARIDAEAERARLHAARVEADRAAAEERAQLETRLRHSERQAALGQLAAGVAHDFNNLLQAVMTGAHSIGQPDASPACIERSAGMIQRAAERGVALTRKMLDFARLGEAGDGAADAHFAPETALRSAQDLLAAILGAAWPVRLRLPARVLPAARGSLAECEAVLLNLVKNARDAMPGGGEIELEAALAETPAALEAEHPGAAPPLCVRIDVRDRGRGMDAATLARAGEAFFTTKRRGEGTGLGLSMARGFAQRAGGLLEMVSVPEQGTTVTLWLPVH